MLKVHRYAQEYEVKDIYAICETIFAFKNILAIRIVTFGMPMCEKHYRII